MTRFLAKMGGYQVTKGKMIRSPAKMDGYRVIFVPR